MSTLKKILWGIFGLTVLAGCLYMIQPVEMVSYDAVLWKVKQANVNEWHFTLALAYKNTPDAEYYKPYIAEFKYPEANNWSYYNRKKLPFPEDMWGFTVYFGKNIPLHGARAKIYRLKNKWTGNYTGDCFVTHVLPAK